MVAPERIEPTLTFENVEEVLSVTRRVAEEDFRRHLQAVIAAQGDEARVAAIANLSKSADAAALADSALKSAITSNTDFRSSTVEAVKGNEIGAASGFKRSGMSMEKGAESLERFANYVPQSKFFAAAISTIQRIDQHVASAEASAQEKVAAFARGLKSFAKGMADFGKDVAATPGRIKEAVKEKAAGVAVSVIVAGVVAEMAVRQQVRQVGAAIGSAVDTVKAGISDRVAAAQRKRDQVRESAWDKIDRFAQAAVDLKNDVADAAISLKNGVTSAAVGIKNDVTNAVTAKVDAVERHSKATVGVATDIAGVLGGTVRKLRDEISARYEAHASAVAADQAQRKEPVMPSKATELALASYSAERAPIAVALAKSNVVSIGGKSSPPVIHTANLDPHGPAAQVLNAVVLGNPLPLRARLHMGLDPNTTFILPEVGGQQPRLSLLEMSRDVATVRLLLEAGANPNQSTSLDAPDTLSQVMSRVAPAERAEAISVMLEHGASPHGNGGVWLTPLGEAMSEGDVESTKTLLGAGAKVCMQDVAVFAAQIERRLSAAHTVEDQGQERAAALGVMKALYASDREGLESILSDSRIVAGLKASPAAKWAVDLAERTVPHSASQPLRLSAQLG
jgi:hypothetical protein